MNKFRFSIFMTVILAVCLLVLWGCSSDDDDKKDDKLTQQQADQAMEDNAPAIYALAYLVAYQVQAAAGGDIDELQIDENTIYSAFLKRSAPLAEKVRAGTLQDDDEFSFDGSGCWNLTYDSTDAVTGYTVDILAQVCFDVYDLLGLPTPSTNQMSYSVAFGFDGADVLQTSSFVFDFGIERDLLVAGIADYNGGTGNLVVSGGADENFDISITTQNGTQALGTDYSYTINNVSAQPALDFPESGDIDFSIGFNATPQLQTYPNYTIEGTITFDGTSVIAVSFAGFSYSMNLTTGQVN